MPCLKLGDLSSERLERNLEMSLWKRWHSALISCTMKKVLANPTRPSKVNTIITRMNLMEVNPMLDHVVVVQNLIMFVQSMEDISGKIVF